MRYGFMARNEAKRNLIPLGPRDYGFSAPPYTTRRSTDDAMWGAAGAVCAFQHVAKAFASIRNPILYSRHTKCVKLLYFTYSRVTPEPM